MSVRNPGIERTDSHPASAAVAVGNDGGGVDDEGVQSSCSLRFVKSSLCASLVWDVHPSEEKLGEFLIRFWDLQSASESGPYIDPSLKIDVKLWMPEHGHGSSPVKMEREKDAAGQVIPGVYRVKNVYFSMPGHWQVQIRMMDRKDVKKIFEQVASSYEYE